MSNSIGSGGGGATTVCAGCEEYACDWRGGGNWTGLSGGVIGLTGGRGGDGGAWLCAAVATVAAAAGGALCGTVGMGTGLFLAALCEADCPAGIPVDAEEDVEGAARVVVVLELLLVGGA